MIITVVVAVCALVAGVLGRRPLRRQLAEVETPTLTVRDFVLPLQALTVFVLAYVLVTASSSHSRAEEAVRQEARVLDHMYEAADFVPAEPRRRLQGDITCYVRAVRSREWPAMAHGHSSSAPETWSRGIHSTLRGLDTKGTPFGQLVSGDEKRDETRQTRIAESTPTIPGPVYWLMLASLAVLVINLGLCLPATKNLTVTLGLVVFTALLTATLLATRDVDRPFGGIILIKPTPLATLERHMSGQYAAAYRQDRLPCDQEGDRRAA
ncbi:bestrophin-like domain [Streptomyces huiliensis]|uniref:bestrophin-like domain n=1 Tax=Streptomyces huiliensis TaxID=2876027 RepID=UPI001CC13428|nr:DUF4239 domain-containing protein [Streptomyces huiliensis]MBZ4320480.1 DUF4239 domain-containing protein [Streptomyces huiliensis]